MKAVYFLQWKWKNMDAWSRWWALGMVLLISSFFASEYVGSVLVALAFIIFFGGMVKWFWDLQVDSWKKFNDEQQKVVDVLKDTK